MKVTILGINGFLSTAIAKYCNQKDWTLDMHGVGEPKFHTCNHCYQVDLLNEEIDYEQVIDSDIIVYAIGAGIQSNLNESSDLIYNLNVTAPVKICNKLRALDYKGVFITFGSVFEMGETMEPKSFDEDDVLSSNCVAPSDYVVSKRMLSRFVTSYRPAFTHWHFIIPTIYGAGENPMRLIPYTVNAIRNRETLHFTAGNQVRQYVHVSEVPELIDLAFQKHLSGGLYCIEGPDTLSVKELVTRIHRSFGLDVPSDCFGTAERKDAGMKYLALDGKKLEKTIGFKAKKHVEDALLSY
jgi:nucleoside-diphosphate-sugar epimerase